jgi:hypothetical protein
MALLGWKGVELKLLKLQFLEIIRLNYIKILTYIARFRQECHNSKFGIFEILV